MRPEYPRPQMRREAWKNLNGEWDMIFDFGRSGEERELYLAENLKKQELRKINIPFCPESKLSGVGYTDFIPALWYTRDFELSEEECRGRVIIHFGAVDYLSRLWINDAPAGTHVGGYSSFSFDITELVRVGKNTLVLYAEDDLRSGRQPFGKQSSKYYSYACSYTRTTGIWQTVWLEFVEREYITSYRVYPDIDSASARIEVFTNAEAGRELTLSASYKGKTVGSSVARVFGGRAEATLDLDELHLWDVGSPELYDLCLMLGDERVDGYFGMRRVEVRKDALYLNGRALFMRTVLDQGFNPDGIYTAPDDSFLRRDIELSMKLGFNGARLHQRVFEERTLYWADKLGYIVWGEYANGNLQSDSRGIGDFIGEWSEVIERDFNHPALIGWIINNESYWMPNVDPICQTTIYNITKRLDTTRPVIDASGGIHFVSDMFDIHDYEQDPKKLSESLWRMINEKGHVHNPLHNQQLSRNVYLGQPYWISEYGGILWGDSGWGYGQSIKSVEEFAERYAGLTHALLECPIICGFCYTQLTDVEQEQNGLYKYDRQRKFSDDIYEIIRRANLSPAAIEQKNKADQGSEYK
ncbi:MAG: beta-galactosidase [Clostridia bacterium]|nr:beta-galactosidase [Clostridia bacterium]